MGNGLDRFQPFVDRIEEVANAAGANLTFGSPPGGLDSLEIALTIFGLAIVVLFGLLIPVVQNLRGKKKDVRNDPRTLVFPDTSLLIDQHEFYFEARVDIDAMRYSAPATRTWAILWPQSAMLWAWKWKKRERERAHLEKPLLHRQRNPGVTSVPPPSFPHDYHAMINHRYGGYVWSTYSGALLLLILFVLIIAFFETYLDGHYGSGRWPADGLPVELFLDSDWSDAQGVFNTRTAASIIGFLGAFLLLVIISTDIGVGAMRAICLTLVAAMIVLIVGFGLDDNHEATERELTADKGVVEAFETGNRVLEGLLFISLIATFVAAWKLPKIESFYQWETRSWVRRTVPHSGVEMDYRRVAGKQYQDSVVDVVQDLDFSVLTHCKRQGRYSPIPELRARTVWYQSYARFVLYRLMTLCVITMVLATLLYFASLFYRNWTIDGRQTRWIDFDGRDLFPPSSFPSYNTRWRLAMILATFFVVIINFSWPFRQTIWLFVFGGIYLLILVPGWFYVLYLDTSALQFAGEEFCLLENNEAAARLIPFWNQPGLRCINARQLGTVALDLIISLVLLGFVIAEIAFREWSGCRHCKNVFALFDHPAHEEQCALRKVQCLFCQRNMTATHFFTRHPHVCAGRGESVRDNIWHKRDGTQMPNELIVEVRSPPIATDYELKADLDQYAKSMLGPQAGVEHFSRQPVTSPGAAIVTIRLPPHVRAQEVEDQFLSGRPDLKPFCPEAPGRRWWNYREDDNPNPDHDLPWTKVCRDSIPEPATRTTILEIMHIADYQNGHSWKMCYKDLMKDILKHHLSRMYLLIDTHAPPDKQDVYPPFIPSALYTSLKQFLQNNKYRQVIAPIGSRPYGGYEVENVILDYTPLRIVMDNTWGFIPKIKFLWEIYDLPNYIPSDVYAVLLMTVGYEAERVALKDHIQTLHLTMNDDHIGSLRRIYDRYKERELHGGEVEQLRREMQGALRGTNLIVGTAPRQQLTIPAFWQMLLWIDLPIENFYKEKAAQPYGKLDDISNYLFDAFTAKVGFMQQQDFEGVCYTLNYDGDIVNLWELAGPSEWGLTDVQFRHFMLGALTKDPRYIRQLTPSNPEEASALKEFKAAVAYDPTLAGGGPTKLRGDIYFKFTGLDRLLNTIGTVLFYVALILGWVAAIQLLNESALGGDVREWEVYATLAVVLITTVVFVVIGDFGFLPARAATEWYYGGPKAEDVASDPTEKSQEQHDRYFKKTKTIYYLFALSPFFRLLSFFTIMKLQICPTFTADWPALWGTALQTLIQEIPGTILAAVALFNVSSGLGILYVKLVVGMLALFVNFMEGILLTAGQSIAKREASVREYYYSFNDQILTLYEHMEGNPPYPEARNLIHGHYLGGKESHPTPGGAQDPFGNMVGSPYQDPNLPVSPQPFGAPPPNSPQGLTGSAPPHYYSSGATGPYPSNIPNKAWMSPPVPPPY